MRKDATKILKSKNTEPARKHAIKKEAMIKDDIKSIAQAQVIGLIDPNADPDVLVKSLENVEPLFKVGEGDEKIDNKILCIILMEGMVREFRGEMIPNFTMAGKLVGRAKSWMHSLWQDRDEILAQKNTLLNQGLGMVQVKLMVTMLKMATALDKVEDWGAFINAADPKSFANFIKFFDNILIRTRLLSNQSTDNVAIKHDHSGTVELVRPDNILE